MFGDTKALASNQIYLPYTGFFEVENFHEFHESIISCESFNANMVRIF